MTFQNFHQNLRQVSQASEATGISINERNSVHSLARQIYRKFEISNEHVAYFAEIL